MDMIENLLCPQVCMDVDDTPLQIEAPADEPEESPEAHLCTLPASLRVRLILDNQFSFKQEQLPHPLNMFEEASLADPLFSEVEYLQKAKLHCTVCNVHIGTSLIEQLNRYIHPELNTLMCYSCYEFYGTGEFEKDEDGSEIYCKWCGQGGVVICCSVCCYVFCSTCVKRNLGVLALTQIRTMDEWQCFLCDPKQLSKFHITSHVLHEYTMKQLKLAVVKRDIIMVKDDISTCCKRKKRKALDSDEEFVPERKKKPKQAANKSSLTNANKPETPPPQPNLFQTLQLQSNVTSANAPIVKLQVSSETVLPSLATLMPSLLKAILPPGTTPKEPIQVQYQPGIQVVNTKPKIKLDWLMKAVGTARVQGHNLLTEIEKVQFSSRSAQNYQDLANMHNQLQRIIASCTAKLVMARKDMHHAFLKYLTLNQISHASIPNDINSPLVMSASVLDNNISTRILNNNQSNEPIDLCDDDDDVVSTGDPLNTSDCVPVDITSDCVPVDITSDSDLQKDKPSQVIGLSTMEYKRAISARVVLTRHDFSKKLHQIETFKLIEQVEAPKIIKKRRSRSRKIDSSPILIVDSPEKGVSECKVSRVRSDLDVNDDSNINAINEEINEERTPDDVPNQGNIITAATDASTEELNSEVINENFLKKANVSVKGIVSDKTKTSISDNIPEETIKSFEITPELTEAVVENSAELNIKTSNSIIENVGHTSTEVENAMDTVQDTEKLDTERETENRIENTLKEIMVAPSEEIFDSIRNSAINTLKDPIIPEVSSFDFVREMQNEIHSTGGNSPLISEINPSVAVVFNAITPQSATDIDTNDNVQSQATNEEVQYVMYSGNDPLACNTGDEVMENSVLDVAPPAISLEEMVKIYE